ncbi:MAG: nucleoside triphosphate pyrophosphohydrolase [Acidimicrobiia bacterium]|nr:nucleoside triphosphate pyrophosphohydrolase [Acidimicrobiia bacterium]
MPGRVVVVGLGPAGADLLLPVARAALERVPVRFARTARHPAVAELEAAGLAFEAFDDRYDAAERIEDVYGVIVDALVEAAGAEGEVAFAVPGNPAVAERTVALLAAEARAGRVELVVVPGLSFAELAWIRLGVDPTGGARVVDAHDLGIGGAGVSGPLLLVQCDSPHVLSEVKLTLLESLDPAVAVTVLQRLGLPDERVEVVPLVDVDRVVEPDHLTALFVDTGELALAPELARFVSLMERLRGPGGCPWDAEQTHHSLARYALEEAYEVVDAIEALPREAPAGLAPGAPLPEGYGALEEELGDLLCQVVFHATLAREAGAFTMADVARGIHDKLVRRHPHVFGDVEVAGPEAVLANWEEIKREEKGAASLVDQITPGLPSLLHVHKLLRKAATVGLEPASRADALAGLRAAARRLGEAEAAGEAEADRALGEVLAAAVEVARTAGLDAETALSAWASRFRARFRALEHLATERGLDLARADPATVRALWEEAAAPG